MGSPTILKAGAIAPSLTLRSTPDQFVSLREFAGHPLIMGFYPAVWSPVCVDQMALYNELLPEFHKRGAKLVGISVDRAWCHAAFSSSRKPHFPLLADFEPKGKVASSYGVYREAEGISERALFVINAEGCIQWCDVSPVGVNPGADGILSALETVNNERLKSMVKRYRSNSHRSGTLVMPVSDRDHIQGQATAPLVLVEYGDYECPYCALARGMIKKIQEKLGDSLRFVFRNFPLRGMHPHAEHAAEAAEAAGAHGKFWEMHDLLFENQTALADEDIARYSASLGLDPAWMLAEINSGVYSERIREDFSSGSHSGVNGTPTLFVNSARFDGPHYAEDIINALIASVPKAINPIRGLATL
jgi:peroxiredoxin/protein-disulfide isomerase